MVDHIDDLPRTEPYLRLIRLGVEEWNRWMKGAIRSRPDLDQLLQKVHLDRFPSNSEQVIFADVDFSTEDNQEITFERAHFNNGVTFQNSTFRRKMNFSNVEFKGEANFNNTTFSDGANFSSAHFIHGCDFTDSIFNDNARFVNAAFDNNVNFSTSQFGKDATFEHCKFHQKPNFTEVTFGSRARFNKTEFRSGALFNGVVFSTDGGSEDAVRFHGAKFFAPVSFKMADFHHKADFSKSEFSSAAYFEYAVFNEEASFQDASFQSSALFANASFYQPPNFEGCIGETRFDVVGITVSFSGLRPKYLWWDEKNNYEHWTIDTAIPTRLRRFRKLMDETKAQDIERNLFILERKAERGIAINRRKLDPSLSPFGPIALLWLYDILSDCGRSASRPFYWFIGKIFAFYALYLFLYSVYVAPSVLLQVSWALFGKGEYPDRALTDILSFTVGHALPLVGSLSSTRDAAIKRLFSSAQSPLIEMPLSIELAAIGQSLTGAILFFLILLAIRNHFRIG